LKLSATLPDIMPQQANRRIKPIYEDIQTTLRVPVVNLIFRTLANYPEYLERAWAQLREIARSRMFEDAADALRRKALWQPTPEPLDVEAVQELRVFNDTIHYVLPKLLLAVTALERASVDDDSAGKPVAPAAFRSRRAWPKVRARSNGRARYCQRATARALRIHQAAPRPLSGVIVLSRSRQLAGIPAGGVGHNCTLRRLARLHGAQRNACRTEPHDGAGRTASRQSGHSVCIPA
jgi:hypothetical protein